MKKVLGVLGFGAVLVAVLIAWAIFNFNGLIKRGVEGVGPEVLQAPVTLEKSDISFMSGSGELVGLKVGNPEGFHTDYAFKLDKVKIAVDIDSISGDTIHVKEVIIDGAAVTYEGSLSKSNISQLMDNVDAFVAKIAGESDGKEGEAKPEEKPETPTQGPKKEEKSKKVVIDRVSITNTTASVSMTILKGKKLTLPLPPIELKDIGKDDDKSFADVIKEIIGSIHKAIIPALKGALTNVGGITIDGLESVGKGTLKGVEGVGKGVKDIGKGIGKLFGGEKKE